MRMIIDTDAGIDDAEAIIMALTYPNVVMEAITTVTGNVHVDKVNWNVCTILQQVGVKVPIYSGADRPLIEPWEHDDRRHHLTDGLGDWDDRPYCDLNLEDEHAALALVRLIRENPGEMTVVALGPLTNLALAVRLYPALLQQVKQLVVMGGAVDAHGNTPMVTAEFNIGADPEAAHIVFGAAPEILLLSWETTIAHQISMADHERLSHLQTTLSRFYHGINYKSMLRHKHAYEGHLLPDPLAMAITLNPALILEEDKRHVVIELHGQHTRGQTVVNFTRRYSSGKRTIRIVRRIDMGGVLAMYEAMLH